MQMMRSGPMGLQWETSKNKLQNVFSPKRSGLEFRESRGNRAGDGIRAAGAGSGRDRAGTFPAEG